MARAEQVSRMCGQVVVGGYLGEEPPASFLNALRQGLRAGAILFRRNIPSWQGAREASLRLADAAGSDPCPIVSVDQEGGRVQRLRAPVLQVPAMRRLAETKSEALIGETARALGSQLRAIGFNVSFAPVLDVDTNPGNPVIGDRSFSRDPDRVARLAARWIDGLQAEGVAACGKHFPGHGDTSVDSHLDLPVVDLPVERLRAVELVPFQAAIRRRIDALMSAHIVVPEIALEVPATLCPEIVDGWLRRDLGFDGVVFSDDLEMGAIADRYGMGEAAVRAVRAGCDVLLICKSEQRQCEAHEALVREVERDPAFRVRCEQAAQRCQALRRRRPLRPAPQTQQIEALFSAADDLQQRLNAL